MKVRAKKTGFYDGIRRREGAVFEFAGKQPGKWMTPVKDDAKAEKAADAKAEEESSDTLSAVGKKNAKRDAKAEGLV